jgi:hypothetical protein
MRARDLRHRGPWAARRQIQARRRVRRVPFGLEPPHRRTFIADPYTSHVYVLTKNAGAVSDSGACV